MCEYSRVAVHVYMFQIMSQRDSNKIFKEEIRILALLTQRHLTSPVETLAKQFPFHR